MAEFMMVERRRKIYKVRRHSDFRNNKELYRFERQNVQWLAQHFLGVTHERRGGALNSEQKIEIFLRYIGDPGFQSGMTEDVGVIRSTGCDTFWVDLLPNQLHDKQKN